MLVQLDYIIDAECTNVRHEWLRHIYEISETPHYITLMSTNGTKHLYPHDRVISLSINMEKDEEYEKRNI